MIRHRTLLERREFQREIARLEALELTPHEAQQILEQFSYESKAERGWMLNSYVLTRLSSDIRFQQLHSGQLPELPASRGRHLRADIRRLVTVAV